MQPVSPGSSVVVRSLALPSRSDIEQLSAIFDAYRVHYGESPDLTRTTSWLEGNINSGCLRAFVAEDDKGFVGFALTMVVPASQRLGHFWQIRDLFVLPSHRRMGVAGTLLEYVRSAALDAHAHRLSLQTEADNAAALSLYLANGYEVVEGYCSLVLPLAAPSGGRALE